MDFTLVANHVETYHGDSVRVATYEGKGRVLLAEVDFEPGERILLEYPLIEVVEDSSQAYQELIRLKQAEQLEFSPIFYWAALSSLTPQQVASACVPWRAVPKETQVQALQLHMEDTSAPSDSVLRIVEALWNKDPPEALLLERLLQAWIYNSFDLSEDGKQAGVIFLASAMMSHSCAPNAAWHLDENNNFILHARCFIQAGEEVTISYLSPEELMLPTLHRRKLLQSTKGFTCGCCRCVEVLDPARAFKCGDCGTEALARAQPDADEEELVCQSCGPEEPGRDRGWALRALQLEAKLTPWARSRPWFSTLAKVRDDVDEDEAPEASLVEGEGVLSDRHWIMDALLAARGESHPQLAIQILQRRLRVHQASPGSAQVKMKQVVSAVARKGAAPQKQKSKLRNSREVQDHYMEQRIREMKKTRRHPNGPAETFRDRVADAITNPIFEMSMMALCLLSAVVVGVEVNWFAQNITATSPPLALTLINHVVSVLFTIELSLKIYVLQLRFFKVDISWHILDVVVVGTGLVELVIDLVNLMNTCENCSESGLDLGILRALRIARAVRLARLARLVQYIRELRRLIISVLATLKSVFWTIVLLALIIYTFAVIFQQAVNDYEQSVLQSNATTSSETEKLFPGLLRTAMTLLQTATGGLSWIEVESALSNISTWLVVIFLRLLLYFSFIYFAVLNVVTGVFCSTAIENASQDAEAQIDEHVRKSKDYSDRLVKVFEKMDTDNTGTISILEFEEMWEDPALQALLSTLGISQSKAWKLFEIMDEDDNGEINADEFVSTCFKLQGSAQRVDTERIYAGLKRLGSAIEDIGSYLQDILQGLANVKSSVELSRRPIQLIPRSGSAPTTSNSASTACASALRKATTMT